MRIIGVIPARLGSTRLQEKVLKLIDGKPMVQRVWERASRAKKIDDLIIACDDERIVSCAQGFGGKAILTRVDHPNGSSRVSEIALREKGDVFINIQGDEPLIHPEGIDQLAQVFKDHPELKVATLAVRKENIHDYQNPNVVKVILNAKGDALYFSRSPLPHYRDPQAPVNFLKHLGIYGYQKQFLMDFVTWQTGVLEEAEKLEQLRILERGFQIRVLETAYDSWSVDTAEDLDVVESKIRESSN